MQFKRLILGSIFILVLFLLCYNYTLGGYYQDSSVINLLEGYPANQILVYGPIIETYKDGFGIYNIKNRKVYHVKTNLKLNLGTDIYILGTLNSNNEFLITKIITFKMDDVFDVFLRSLLGLIIFLVVFVKFWRFSPGKLLFIRLQKTKPANMKDLWRLRFYRFSELKNFFKILRRK